MPSNFNEATFNQIFLKPARSDTAMKILNVLSFCAYMKIFKIGLIWQNLVEL